MEKQNLREIIKKHTETLICNFYPGNPTRTDSMCAARRGKAEADPERLTYTLCLNCRVGEEALSSQPNLPRRRISKFTKTNTRLCTKCGKPTRGKVCAICKIEEEKGKKEEKQAAKEAFKMEKKLCSNNDGIQVHARGLCKACYGKASRAGSLKTDPRRAKTPTTVQKVRKQAACRSDSLPDTHTDISTDGGIHPSSETPAQDSVGYLAQLLLCSQTIDIEIKNLLETDRFEPKNIADVRFRLGAILRESIR